MADEVIHATCGNCGTGFPLRGPRPVVSCPKCGKLVKLDLVKAPPPPLPKKPPGPSSEVPVGLFQCLQCGRTYEWSREKGQSSVPVCPACDCPRAVARSPMAAVIERVSFNKAKVKVIKTIRSSFHQLTEIRRRVQDLQRAIEQAGLPTPQHAAIQAQLKACVDNIDSQVEAFLNARLHERLEKMGIPTDEDSIKAWIRSSS